jgi:hypothetical protein
MTVGHLGKAGARVARLSLTSMIRKLRQQSADNRRQAAKLQPGGQLSTAGIYLADVYDEAAKVLDQRLAELPREVGT